jgi:adenylate kinase
MRLYPALTAVAVWAAMTAPVYSAGLVVMVVGPPGSGRTTQAQQLGKDLGMPILAVDDLIRKNPQVFQKKPTRSDAGADPRLDQAMNQVMSAALATSDLAKGVVLDGYPASKAQGDFLETLRQKHDLPRAIVIHLNVPDDVVRKRLKGQKRDVEQELKDYHREFDFIRTYFPEADIRAVDGAKKATQVAKEIRKLVEGTAR